MSEEAMIDILATAWKKRWEGNGTLTGLVPGGLHFGVVKADAASPYASLAITAEETTRFTGDARIARAQLTITVHADQLPATSETIRKSIESTFHRQDVVQGAIRLPIGYRIMDLLELPGSHDAAPVRRRAEDVLVLVMTWRVTLQVGGV